MWLQVADKFKVILFQQILVNDKFNKYDNKTLEVYFDGVYIGYVKKAFEEESIDYIELVDGFCFREEKLLNIKLFWNGLGFYLQKDDSDFYNNYFLRARSILLTTDFFF